MFKRWWSHVSPVWQRVWWLGLVMAGLMVVAALYTNKYGQHVSGLIGLSKHFSDPKKVEGMFTWGAPGGSGYEGYDGQFFFELAHDPFHQHIRRESFDNLPYRSQRMLYPVLVHVVSGGGTSKWVPGAMVAVNVAALLAMVWGLMWLAGMYGKPVWWGPLLVVTMGVLWPYTRCLAEPLAMSFLVWAAIAHVKHRPGWTGVLLAFACLAREQSMGYVVFFAWMAGRVSWKRGALVAGIPIAVWAGWQAYIHHLYGVWPILAITQYPMLSWPGHGWSDRIIQLATKGHGHCEGVEAVFLFWFLGATIWWGKEALGRRFQISLGSWLTLATLALGWVVTVKVWEDFCSSTRTLGFLPFAMLFSEMEEAHSAKRKFLWVAVVMGVAWLICDVR